MKKANVAIPLLAAGRLPETSGVKTSLPGPDDTLRRVLPNGITVLAA